MDEGYDSFNMDRVRRLMRRTSLCRALPAEAFKHHP